MRGRGHHHAFEGFIPCSTHKIFRHSLLLSGRIPEGQQKRPLSLAEHGLVSYLESLGYARVIFLCQYQFCLVGLLHQLLQIGNGGFYLFGRFCQQLFSLDCDGVAVIQRFVDTSVNFCELLIVENTLLREKSSTGDKVLLGSSVIVSIASCCGPRWCFSASCP